MLARRSIAGVFHGSPSFLIVQSLFKLDSEAPLKETSPTVFAQSFFKRISSQSDSFNANVGSLISETQSKSMVGSTPYVDIPKPLPKRKRKPLITPIKELIRRARKVREMNQDVTERVLQRPENGLLVRRLVPVAHQVYQAKTALYEGVAKLVDVIPVQACRNCSEVHIGSQGHQLKTCEGPMSCSSKKHVWRKGTVDDILVTVESFHLYDRVGRAVTHKERFMVDRLPAIIELCIQAGLDLPDFPTKRRAYPVYMVAGKIVDFEKCSPPKDSNSMDVDEDFESRDFWDSKKQPKRDESPLSTAEDIQRMAQQTLEAWEDMKSGARKLMEKYAVKTCAYCPEVQVGPKGHRARICQAHKHQWRDGQHGWQEATFDDLIPPKYVWHVCDPNGPPLENKLRKYYGMAPAVVELCVQGGATVPNDYKSMMRLDVTIPDFEEIKENNLKASHNSIQWQENQQHTARSLSRRRIGGGIINARIGGGIINASTLQSLEYRKDLCFPLSLILHNTRPAGYQDLVGLITSVLLLGDFSLMLLTLLQFYSISLGAFFAVLLILPLALLSPFPAGINALFSHGHRRSADLARVYALWNVTSLVNVVVVLICAFLLYRLQSSSYGGMQNFRSSNTISRTIDHQIKTALSFSVEEGRWWIFPTALLLCKCVQACMVDWHITNLEIQDYTLYSSDPAEFWDS